MSAISCVAHPALYELAREALVRVEDHIDDVAVLKAWSLVFNALSIISNRETLVHQDRLSKAEWYVKKKEVEKRMWDLYRVKPGQSGYIGKGEEWYINEPSEEVRQKVAKMKGRKVVKDFQMQATRDLGMLSFVLTAHRDTNGTICVSFHEQNDKAGFELFSKVQPNWKNVKIWEAWEKYAQSQFSDIDGSVPKESLPSKQKEKIKLPLDDNGYPILVDEDLSSPATFSDLQAIIRSLLMTHYQISTGNAKASVPWTSLAERPGNYIDLSKGYIPPGYRFREP
ncbi:hypothetical protein SERLADRAFT_432088 [Serpula lacrymans var. lacrymans S7.9]|uniref:Uncharacterized protein n=1 Tax=Serpula lacrymans var. lacrymans (strain S7.9) TaxID=578457 RepID=F8NDZ1_SERL9|nr:uncharacterized protein SERLADRAFT_432088 [Serpula lacrymans var. lacrymans S7.9]EGO30519.1 hypothetical protein SERLADRAFT_432088 [Serpula lacrymans var. lacrymans S7.9]